MFCDENKQNASFRYSRSCQNKHGAVNFQSSWKSMARDGSNHYFVFVVLPPLVGTPNTAVDVK